MVIRGSYYLSGDSVLFQAGIMDVASGRMLRSFDPVGAPVERAMDALEALRERIAGGLSPLVNPLTGVARSIPTWFRRRASPPTASSWPGSRRSDWEAEAEHYRRAARLDSTFVAPLIQLAFRAMSNDECSITDSIGAVLDPRRDQLTAWNRMTIDVLRAHCRGDMAEAVRLLEQRYRAYPRSVVRAGPLCNTGLQDSNQPRAAREILRAGGRFWSDRIPRRHGVAVLVLVAHGRYLAHAGRVSAELGITDRWRDSAAAEWQVDPRRVRSPLSAGSER